MITVEKAINRLREIKDVYIVGGDESFDNERKESLDMAIYELSAKQTAIKKNEEMIQLLKENPKAYKDLMKDVADIILILKKMLSSDYFQILLEVAMEMKGDTE